MTSRPEKAQLHVLDKDGNTKGQPIPVQFNPTTMSLQMTNSIDGNDNNGRQARKYTGTSSATLSIDLEFDTADEGTNDKPVDVRDLTKEVAQFVLPSGKDAKAAPPQVKFEWGTFELAGVMSSLSEELSLFSPDGVPLRAKLSVQIKEQDPKYIALKAGAGAGTSGSGKNDKVDEAKEGETAADFLARNGLAPEAWKALGGALDALGEGIELPVGLAIPFPSSLSIGGGLGFSAGFGASLDLSVEASLGLGSGPDTPSSSGAVPTGSEQAKALTAAGGLTAAVETSKTATATAASNAARKSFGIAAESPESVSAASGASPRQPVAAAGSARTLAPSPAPPAPPPPKADPRGTSFGRGVPLRDRVAVPGSESEGWVVVGQTPPTDTIGPSRGAPWEQLQPSRARLAADREQDRRSPSCGCHRCDPRGRQRYRS